jgi:RNA polymerase sigma-70 factor (ECF subfamily)
LHREGGLTYKQISEQKNISVKTVEKKISHALKQIRLGIDDALAILVVTHFLH